jgi:ADP-ribosylglycohydrolase
VRDDTDLASLSAEVAGLAERSAAVTHNHPEGIKGAQAVAEAILYMRVGRKTGGTGDLGERRAALRDYIEQRYGYDLDRTLDGIRPTYEFTESCQECVPEAIIAFLESTDFEDAIRNAVSIGGDSDTIAAITGPIAEAAYGIPDWIKEKAWSYLDDPIKEICRRWREFLKAA